MKPEREAGPLIHGEELKFCAIGIIDNGNYHQLIYDFQGHMLMSESYALDKYQSENLETSSILLLSLVRFSERSR